MNTTPPDNGLGAALFGRTRRAVLTLLYSHAEDAIYLRQLSRLAGVGLGSVQREVKRLSEAGIIRRHVRGSQVYYQANPQCPIFSELQSLVIKTAGAGEVLRAALAPLGDLIRVAFIYGSLARGEVRPGSDVDLVVIGSATFSQIVPALGPAQEALGREVNPTVYPPAEFRSKLAAGNHFLTTVMRGARIYLIGNEDELERLAE